MTARIIILWMIWLLLVVGAIALTIAKHHTEPRALPEVAFRYCPWSADPAHRQPLQSYYV